MESAAVGLPFGVRAPIAGTLPVREASAPSGADAAPSAGKRLVAGADCDGGVPRGTPSAGAAEVAFRGGIDGRTRSEEHTSELQSLMRISYAVFCLKKKKQ